MTSTKNAKTTNTTETTATTRTRKGTNVREIASVVKAVEAYTLASCRETMNEAKYQGPDAIEEAKESCKYMVIEFNQFKNKLIEFVTSTPELDKQATESGLYKLLDELPEALKQYREKRVDVR